MPPKGESTRQKPIPLNLTLFEVYPAERVKVTRGQARLNPLQEEVKDKETIEEVITRKVQSKPKQEAKMVVARKLKEKELLRKS